MESFMLLESPHLVSDVDHLFLLIIPESRLTLTGLKTLSGLKATTSSFLLWFTYFTLNVFSKSVECNLLQIKNIHEKIFLILSGRPGREKEMESTKHFYCENVNSIHKMYYES